MSGSSPVESHNNEQYLHILFIVSLVVLAGVSAVAIDTLTKWAAQHHIQGAPAVLLGITGMFCGGAASALTLLAPSLIRWIGNQFKDQGQKKLSVQVN